MKLVILVIHGESGISGENGYAGETGGGSVGSGCHELSENVWFVWSKMSYSGISHLRTDTRTDRTRR